MERTNTRETNSSNLPDSSIAREQNVPGISEFWPLLLDNADKDKNGFYSKTELNDGARAHSAEHKMLFEFLEAASDTVQGLHDDEYFSDNDGVTTGDVLDLDRLLKLEKERIENGLEAKRIFTEVYITANLNEHDLSVTSGAHLRKILDRIIKEPDNTENRLALPDDDEITKQGQNGITYHLNSSGVFEIRYTGPDGQIRTIDSTNIFNGDSYEMAIFGSGSISITETRKGFRSQTTILTIGSAVESVDENFRKKIADW